MNLLKLFRDQMKSTKTQSKKFNDQLVKQALVKCWSKQSSSLWTENNPARGQCGVTAIVIQEQFGGEILKTNIDGQWHFYNVIDGVKYDLTVDQFDEPPTYSDIPSNREEAFADTNKEQHTYLSSKFSQLII
jgi:hypothetical protein